MKKVISYLITAMMVFTMIPSIAFAGTADDQQTSQNMRLHIEQSNPLYAGGNSEPVVEVVEQTPLTAAADEITPNGFTVIEAASTVEEAAELLRPQLVYRQTMAVTKIYVQESDLNADSMTAIGNQIFDSAMQHTGKVNEGDSLQYVWGNQDCTIDVTVGSGGYIATLTYNISYYTTAEQEAALTDAVESLKEELNLDGKTDYEKVKAIYDYMTANIAYDYEHYGNDDYKLQFTAYAAMVKGTAVCQGYATLFYRLACEYGIDARIISGESLNMQGKMEGHSWNIVKLGDKYYYLDATWDAGLREYNYFLKGYENFENHISNEEYTTAEFMSAYPVAKDDYVPGADDDQSGSEEPDTPGDEGDFTVEIRNGKAKITKYTGNEAHVVVPAEINGYPVKTIGHEAFYSEYGYRDNGIECIEISEGIELLEANCISHYNDLKKVIIPSTARVQYGGDFSICYCPEVTTVEVAESNPYIRVFEGAIYSKNMKQLLYYPAGIKAEVLKIPDGVKQIVSASCCFNKHVKEVIMPDTVAEIGYWAFEGCSSLEKINISENCEFLGQYAFVNTKISSLHIPESLTTILAGAFDNTQYLKQITVDSNNKEYYTIDGVLMSDDWLMLYPGSREGEQYVIPDGVRGICHGAFSSVRYLDSVIVSDTVTNIGYDAFGTSKLRSVTVPASVTNIDEDAFLGADWMVVYGEKDSAVEKCLLEYYGGSSIEFLPIGTGKLSGAYKGSGGDSAEWNIESNVLNITGTGYLGNSYESGMTWNRYRALVKDVVIDGKDVHINEYSLSEYVWMKSIVFGEGVESATFGDCYRLETVTVLNPECEIEITFIYNGQEITIYAPKDSKAEAYAKENNINFVQLCDQHEYEIIDGEKNCLFDSYDVYKCTKCGYSYKCNFNQAIGYHTYCAWKVAEAATLTDAGTVTRQCASCDVIQTQDIAKVKNINRTYAAVAYNGNKRTPVKVKDATGKTLKEGTDYEVEYLTNCKNVGVHKIKVVLMGKYKGEKTISFTINPKSTTLNKVTSPAKKQIKVTWAKRTAQVTGYQIRYSTKQSMANAKNLKVTSFKTNTKTIKNLKSKQKYYVQIRTYKNVNGKAYYSAWSKAKTIITK